MVDLALPDFPSNYLSDFAKHLNKNNLYSNVPIIFADCFEAVTSKTPSLPNFAAILESNTAINQTILSETYNRVFGIISGLFKSLPGTDDFKQILAGIELPTELHKECIKSYKTFLELVKIARKGWSGLVSIPDKKISECGSANYLGVRFAELINIEWMGTKEICNSHLARVGEPEYLIRMYILTNDLDQSVYSIKEMSQSLHELRIKAIEFTCNYSELQHMLYRTNEALHEVDQFSIPQ